MINNSARIYLSEITRDYRTNSVYQLMSNFDLERTINRVERFFIDHDREFSWRVYSDDSPGYKQALLDRGYICFETALVMEFDLANLDTTLNRFEQLHNPDIKIIKADYGRMMTDDVLWMVARAFGGDEIETTRNIFRQQQQSEEAGGIQYGQYLAEIDGKVAGFATLMGIPGMNVGKLGGAATDEQFRKQGVYSALLRARLEEGIHNGLQKVFITASSQTSAPILQKYGFREIGQIEEYSRHC